MPVPTDFIDALDASRAKHINCMRIPGGDVGAAHAEGDGIQELAPPTLTKYLARLILYISRASRHIRYIRILFV